MHILKHICLTMLELVKRAWSFPQTVVTAIRQRKRNTVQDQNEIERLDRIRNPSKYLGK